MKKKNLLYVFADQWRYDAMGCKNSLYQTPHMDAFQKESFDFTQAVSTYPLCSPHRASLLTGKYPFCCGFWTNCKDQLDEVVMLKPQEVTITDVLHDAGYQNAYLGKWHLDGSDLNFWQNPPSGCTGWDAYTPEGERRHHIDFWYSYGAMNNHMNPHYWTGSDPERITHHNKWSPEVETEVAIDFLEHQWDKEKPFSMFISWNPPHSPYEAVPDQYYDKVKDRPLPLPENVPEEFRNNPDYLTEHKQYIAAVEGLDDNFGKLIAYLKENDLYEDTIVVLSADHGDCMGAHGLYGKNYWYEESIRIPLMIHGGVVGQSDAMLASQDHMPTLLDMLGVQIPATVQGISYAKMLAGQEMPVPEEAFLCMFPGLPDMVDSFRLRGLNNKSFGWRALRTKTHTYLAFNRTIYTEKSRRQLFDNVNDPQQLHPIELTKEETAVWNERLKKYLALTNDPFLIDFEN